MRLQNTSLIVLQVCNTNNGNLKLSMFYNSQPGTNSIFCCSFMHEVTRYYKFQYSCPHVHPQRCIHTSRISIIFTWLASHSVYLLPSYPTTCRPVISRKTDINWRRKKNNIGQRIASLELKLIVGWMIETNTVHPKFPPKIQVSAWT